MSEPLLDVRNVVRSYARGGLLMGEHFRAVDGVSFRLEADRPEIFRSSASPAAARPRSPG